MPYQAEYIWIDGSTPTQRLRSKTRILEDPYNDNANEYPIWGFDGSSTFQAEGHDSDCVLRPVCSVEDTVRGFPNRLVLCEVYNADGTPHKSNTRAELRRVLEAGADKQEPWFGIEQEYTLFRGNTPLGWPDGGYPAPQGPYYCGVGADEVFGREIVERHTKACLLAGLLLSGTNAEVMPGQWEFQIGAGDPLTVSDHLWIARWLLYRIGEDYGVNARLDPKPVRGDWNGAGAHTNFSTAAMREPHVEGGEPRGLEAIKEACLRLKERHAEHLVAYGDGIEQRLTGQHETCSHREFRWGIADRTASVRIPRMVRENGYGYLEDRRPCANADPYAVTAKILQTVCGVE